MHAYLFKAIAGNCLEARLLVQSNSQTFSKIVGFTYDLYVALRKDDAKYESQKIQQ
jgi:hypothetical protein